MRSKKTLKAEYKDMESVMGVFMVKNDKNSLCLIDSSPDIMSKWNRHRAELRFGSHLNMELQNDWNKFGETCFTFEILSELKQSDAHDPNYHMEVKKLEKIIKDDLKLSAANIY